MYPRQVIAVANALAANASDVSVRHILVHIDTTTPTVERENAKADTLIDISSNRFTVEAMTPGRA